MTFESEPRISQLPGKLRELIHNQVAAADPLSQKWFNEKAKNTDTKKEFAAIKTKLINPIKSKMMGILWALTL